MTTAILEKRVSILEKELRALRAAILLHPTSKTPVQKLSRGLRAGLLDAKAGRISGPFRSVDALMKHLEK